MKPKFKMKRGGAPIVDGAHRGAMMKAKPAAIKPQATAVAKPAKPSGTNKGPSAQAFAHANANASFKRAVAPAAAAPSASKPASARLKPIKPVKKPLSR